MQLFRDEWELLFAQRTKEVATFVIGRPLDPVAKTGLELPSWITLVLHKHPDDFPHQ